MQAIAVMALFGLFNIVGMGFVSEKDMERRGIEGAEYRATVEIEEVSIEQRESLLGALND